MNEIPILRHFIACREIEASIDRKGVTLQELIHTVIRMPGESFPCVQPTMALFALLTNGRGMHEFALELTRLEVGEERLVYPRLPVGRLDLGRDPTIVHGLPIPLKNLVFDRAGQYAFHFLCDGQSIAEEQIFVR